MAQANSVQREPSMEEILASIRRIIEDSDTTRKTLDESEAAIAPADFEPELQAAVEVEAFRTELAAGPKPFSLSQIQAEMARDARIDPAPVREAWSRPAAVPRREAEREPVVEPAIDEDEFEDAADVDVATHAGVVEQTSVYAENQNPRPAILSDRAGRQVAAAFGELEAFASSHRKSFDEVAEDMMRPMLQDWLDNNLPHLVERLVREEIERVARGVAR